MVTTILAMKNKRYWITGVYENYSYRGLGSSFELTPGIQYGKTKETIVSELHGVNVIHDPIYHVTLGGMFQEYTPEMFSAYMFDQLRADLVSSQSQDTIVLHSPIDIYAEYIQNGNRRRKWVDELLKATLETVNIVFYIRPCDQDECVMDERLEKYHNIVKRLIHDFSVRFVTCSYKNVASTINTAKGG
jgi:hypothetical protein